MKRILSLALSLLLICSLSSPAAAARITEGSDVVVEYITTYEGEYRAELSDGEALVTLPDGTLMVTNAPAAAVTLVVIPMEGEAFAWIDGRVEDDALAAYDIHFEDAQGSRINANGAKVSITASGTDLTVSAVTTSGAGKALSAEISGGRVSFTTDGSHYYAICGTSGEQPGPGDTLTVPVRGDENTVHADVTVEGDTVTLHELDFEEIDHVVGDHVDTGVVEIDLTGLSGSVTKIALPMATVEHIVEAAEEAHNDTEALQIDFPQGSVKLDDKTMRAIVEQAEGSEVVLVLENVGKTRLNDSQKDALSDQNVYGGYEAYLLCTASNQRISDFEGGVATLSVPFTVPAGMDADKFAVWYVADDGETEKLSSWMAENVLYWDVGHFSDFIITYEGELPHAHSYTDVVTGPTCTEQGYTTYTCSCGDSYVDNYVAATGHSFTEYVSNNDATCTKDGTKTAKCDHGCGETDTVTDKGSKLGHNYVDGKCTRCGAVSWIPQTGDSSNILLWTGVLILSLIALFFLFFGKRRKKDEA